MQCSIYNLPRKSSCYKRDSMINLRIRGEIFLYMVYSTTMSRYVVYDSIRLILLYYGYCCSNERCGPLASCSYLHKSRKNPLVIGFLYLSEYCLINYILQQKLLKQQYLEKERAEIQISQALIKSHFTWDFFRDDWRTCVWCHSCGCNGLISEPPKSLKALIKLKPGQNSFETSNNQAYISLLALRWTDLTLNV